MSRDRVTVLRVCTAPCHTQGSDTRTRAGSVVLYDVGSLSVLRRQHGRQVVCATS